MARLLGPILATPSIERLAYDLIDRYIGLYLDEVTRQEAQRAGERTIDRIERPRSVVIYSEMTGRLTEDQLPAIVLVCPGTDGPPRRTGDGTYRATWPMGVTAIVQSADAEQGRDIAGVMAAAGAALLLQALAAADDRILSVTWTGESLTAGPGDDDRSRHYCTRGLDIAIEGVMCDLGGPPPELPDPPLGDPPADAGDLQTVETVGLNTNPVQEIE